MPTTETLNVTQQQMRTVAQGAADMAYTIAREAHGNSLAAHRVATTHLEEWLVGTSVINRDNTSRDRVAARAALHRTADTIIDCIEQLNTLHAGVIDPLLLIGEGFRGTSTEARTALIEQYEMDLTTTLERLTWNQQ